MRSATVDVVTRAPEHVFLADPGALLATTHEVGDGLRVRLRLARASDTARVRAFLEALSPETLHRRFFTAMPQVPEHVVRHFTFFDPRERLIVVAVAMQEGGEQILGLADVVMQDTGAAELAVVVADGVQNQGVGTLLTEVIASMARRQGATHLYAELLDHNEPMLRLMNRLGQTVSTAVDGTTRVTTRLPEASRRAA